MTINYGDIFQLGNHCLMCGNATKREDIEKLIDGYTVDLILTDPPYGMKIQNNDGSIGGGKGTRKYSKLIGDNNQDTAQQNYEIIKDLCKKQIIWGGQYFADFLPVNGGWIFWDKQNGANDFSDGELAWRSWGKKVCKYEHKWNGVIRDGSRKFNGIFRAHPTQKPVELHMKILQDFSNEGDIVLDCFGGSGTTLIACEQVNRKCLMMELSPEYCEIIINRWENLSSLINKAERIDYNATSNKIK